MASRRRFICTAASFIVLTSTTAALAQNVGGKVAKDAWETEPPAHSDWKSCSSLRSLLVKSVFEKSRPAAVALLENTEIVRLGETQAAAFIGAENASAPAYI